MSWFGGLILDALFPHYCCGCQTIGTLLCDNCRPKLAWLMWPVQIASPNNYLDQVVAGYEYTALAKAIVRRCKYDRVKATAKLMAELCCQVMNFPATECLCPVPLHPKRQTERGFNQAEELALGISQHIAVPVLNLLTRTIHSAQQAKAVSQTERLNQLAGHFAVNSDFLSKSRPIPNSVTLIDDVVTTGSTLSECAKVLKSAGVGKVYGVNFAHGL